MYTNDKVLCIKAWSEVLIRENGNVYLCCHSKCIGSLKEHTFEEIWNSELMQEVRKCFINGEFHPICDSPSCPVKTEKRCLCGD